MLPGSVLVVVALVGGPVAHGSAVPVVPAAAPGADSDTVVAVTRDDRLVLENFHGTLHVGTGEGSVVRLRRRSEERGSFRIHRADGRITVRTRSHRGREGGGPFRVTVPPWLEVDVRGPRTEAEVEGLRSGVGVVSLHGSIRLRDVRGRVEARTVDGRIVAEEVAGTVRLRSVEGDVGVRGASGGALVVETVDGDVDLLDVGVERLSASSVDGDVRLEGRLPPAGRYRLSTHDGDLRVTLAEPVDAAVVVSTFDGEFIADFPVTLRRFRGGQEMRFTLGRGRGELVLEAFDGDIELRRSGG